MERDGEAVNELGFIQRRVSMGESCLLEKIARPNLTRSFVEERRPPVL